MANYWIRELIGFFNQFDFELGAKMSLFKLICALEMDYDDFLKTCVDFDLANVPEKDVDLIIGLLFVIRKWYTEDVIRECNRVLANKGHLKDVLIPRKKKKITKFRSYYEYRMREPLPEMPYEDRQLLRAAINAPIEEPLSFRHRLYLRALDHPLEYVHYWETNPSPEIAQASTGEIIQLPVELENGREIISNMSLDNDENQNVSEYDILWTVDDESPLSPETGGSSLVIEAEVSASERIQSSDEDEFIYENQKTVNAHTHIVTETANSSSSKVGDIDLNEDLDDGETLDGTEEDGEFQNIDTKLVEIFELCLDKRITWAEFNEFIKKCYEVLRNNYSN